MKWMFVPARACEDYVVEGAGKPWLNSSLCQGLRAECGGRLTVCVYMTYAVSLCCVWRCNKWCKRIEHEKND